MFFYYQTRTHHYKTAAIPHLTCPVCHTASKLNISILQKYMWVLGPVAPSRKYAVAFCEHCSNYITKVKWTDEMDASFRSLKQGLKTPGRLYRGLIVFPLIVAAVIGVTLLFVKGSQRKQQNNQALIKEAIAHPKPGDIFQITHTDGSIADYTYFKVAQINGDSVYVNPSNRHYTSPKDMKKWDEVPTEASAFEPQLMAFSISATQKTDMFTYATQPVEYGMVWSLFRDGTLYKKY